MERVRPKRGLAPVQSDAGHANDQLGTIEIRHGMHRGQRGAQFARIDPRVPTSALEAVWVSITHSSTVSTR